MKRVLVTGATGFIGARALAPLRERGFDVHAVSRSRPEGAAAESWHEADLLDDSARAELVRELRPTHLLHLAWYAEHGKFWTSLENVRWVAATVRLAAEFAAAGGRRAVFAGTCAEYEWGHGTCSEATTPLDPATLYGKAKDATRRVVEAAADETGISTAWGRVFFLYGPREHPGRLVSSVARALVSGERAATSDGHQLRDFMHVDDVAAAFAALLASEVEGAVNVASGEPVALRTVIERIAAAAGRPDLLDLGALPPRPGDPPELVGAVARLHDEVGFRPAYTLDDGLAETVEWWRQRPGLA